MARGRGRRRDRRRRPHRRQRRRRQQDRHVHAGGARRAPRRAVLRRGADLDDRPRRLPTARRSPSRSAPRDEVSASRRRAIAPDGVGAANRAFDVTPARLVTAIVTEAASSALRTRTCCAAPRRRRCRTPPIRSGRRGGKEACEPVACAGRGRVPGVVPGMRPTGGAGVRRLRTDAAAHRRRSRHRRVSTAGSRRSRTRAWRGELVAPSSTGARAPPCPGSRRAWPGSSWPPARRTPPTCATWTPTTSARRNARGFDHAEVLARAVARELGLRARPDAAPATGTPADRPARSRPSCRAAIRRPPRRLPARVLLVDDVATTGATIAAAAEALRRAGVTSVVAVTAARTPRPGAAPRVRPDQPAYTRPMAAGSRRDTAGIP